MADLRFKYQTFEFGDTDIHVRSLRDNQQFQDDDNIAAELGISSATWPLFGIIWGSGEILAHLMQDFDIANKRILEVGCGIALPSLVLNSRLADITATDYHPEAGNFLLKNTLLNESKEIPFVQTGWTDDPSKLGKFDIIIGSDLLYEKEHAEDLANFIQQHARQNCHVIIIDPGRNHASRFNRHMDSFGYSHSQTAADNIDQLTQHINGAKKFKVHTYCRNTI